MGAFRAFVTEFQEQKNKIQNGVALFIDEVDPTLQSLLRFPHPSDNSYDGKQSPAVEYRHAKFHRHGQEQCDTSRRLPTV